MFVVACASDPKTEPGPATTTTAKNLLSACVGDDAPCKAVVVLTASPISKDKAQRRAKSHSISGRCEIVVDPAVAQLQSSPPPQTCLSIRIRMHKSSSSEERTEWIDGNDFVIKDLSAGNYRLKAYTEQFQTSEKIDVIKPGQDLLIQIKLMPRTAAASKP